MDFGELLFEFSDIGFVELSVLDDGLLLCLLPLELLFDFADDRVFGFDNVLALGYGFGLLVCLVFQFQDSVILQL
jgi:hypothetical protein